MKKVHGVECLLGKKKDDRSTASSYTRAVNVQVSKIYLCSGGDVIARCCRPLRKPY